MNNGLNPLLKQYKERPQAKTWITKKIMDAIDDADGSKLGAAERLGLDRRTFYRLLKRLNIESKVDEFAAEVRDIKKRLKASKNGIIPLCRNQTENESSHPQDLSIQTLPQLCICHRVNVLMLSCIISSLKKGLILCEACPCHSKKL